MLLKTFEDKGLAHYSYAVGCPGAGEVAIVDPRRDIDLYVEFARERELAITHVLETHIHADFASGARELARKAGAELLVSAYDEGEEFEVGFPHSDLHDGESLRIGVARITALHTPGHTPEHLSYLVYDESRSKEVPMALLSGDFLFVGSLGRPDLLGEGAKEGLARALYKSVREKLPSLPDSLEIRPAHGSGSMCGAGMSGRPVSTLGYERLTNPYLDPDLGEEAFVERILSEAPPFPDYYRRMKRVNSDGPRILGGLPGLRPIPAKEFKSRLEDGAAVIDLRSQSAFGEGHVPGAFGIGAGEKVSQWASWLVPYDTPLLLVLPDESALEDSVRRLVRVGLDEVAGYLQGGLASWRKAGYPLGELPQIQPRELHLLRQRDEGLRVVDVRTEQEWREGHLSDAIHVMAGEIEERLGDIPSDGATRLAVICGTGYRSTAAASVLQRHGYDNVLNVAGGWEAWKRQRLPVAE